MDASTIKYRAQTTPEYSPRTSPRAQAAAEKGGLGRGSRRQRKPKPLPEWNTDTTIDQTSLYGAMDNGGEGEEEMYGEDGYEEQARPKLRQSRSRKPEWNSDFVEGGSELDKVDSFAEQRQRQQEDARRRRGEERRENQAAVEQERLERERAAATRQPRRMKPKPKPDWNSEGARLSGERVL